VPYFECRINKNALLQTDIYGDFANSNQIANQSKISNSFCSFFSSTRIWLKFILNWEANTLVIMEVHLCWPVILVSQRGWCSKWKFQKHI